MPMPALSLCANKIQPSFNMLTAVHMTARLNLSFLLCRLETMGSMHAQSKSHLEFYA